MTLHKGIIELAKLELKRMQEGWPSACLDSMFTVDIFSTQLGFRITRVFKDHITGDIDEFTQKILTHYKKEVLKRRPEIEGLYPWEYKSN